MRRLLRFLLYRPIVWFIVRYTSRPISSRVFSALTKLLREISKGSLKKGPLIPFDPSDARFIIFSDQHKGARNGADDFLLAEPNYLAALEYYNVNDFHFISLGDNEEFWENSLAEIKKHNVAVFAAEKKFLDRQAFTKIFGNHDLYWDNDPFASQQLKEIYGIEFPVYEGIVLSFQINNQRYSIFCTHGHQGDTQSDGNWFSKMFISLVWGPLQSFLRINPNLPSTNDTLKTAHNQMMYEWSAKQTNLLLITGHTHQPVFASMTHYENIFYKLGIAREQKKADVIAALEAEVKLHGYAEKNFGKLKPTYFNSGCCCFDDGDITGIEIEGGKIRLIKWDGKKNGTSERVVLEEVGLEEVFLVAT